MIFRKAKPEEAEEIYREGYNVWSKNRTFAQYTANNMKKDRYGTHYVIEDNGAIVSSLILLDLSEIMGQKVYGIGSVVTPPSNKHKGYASELLKHCMEQIEDTAPAFLYSEVPPAFYERFRFRVLPPYLQRDAGSICMVRCEDEMYYTLLQKSIESIPEHFRSIFNEVQK